MKEAPIPKNEKKRLESLMALEIMDTKPEERFDRIVKAAVMVFNVPICTVTLIDLKREWFKSMCGSVRREGGRSISFCGHALLARNMYIVPDAHKDLVFKDNPSVVGPPHIRFYAGVPIKSNDGARVGVFCIKDTKPRIFSEKEKKLLRQFAKWAQDELVLSEIKKKADQCQQSILSQKLIIQLTKVLSDVNLSKHEALKIVVDTLGKKLNTGVNYDITYEKEVDQLKTEFISLASHQLRTPIASIKLFGEMLLQEKNSGFSKKQMKYLQNILVSSERMIHLINDLLNLSRLEAGYMSIRPVPMLPRQVMSAVSDELNEIAVKNKVKIHFKSSVKSRIMLDPHFSSEIFSILISNAIRYSKKTGGTVEVEIVKKKGEYVLSVKDDGIGIPKSAHSKIFTKFFRSDNAVVQRADGTGLGLYLCKLIVEAAGGRIWFTSRVNRGTTFFCAIPLAGMKVCEGKKSF